MVKKLFKHECNAYLRTVIPMHLVLIGIALLGRFVQLFENDSDAYNIVFWSSVVVFIIGCVACTILTMVFGIRRFYTNMFTTEGYLTLTLPVTPTQHIVVKNLVAVLMQVASLVMITFSVCVITLGDVCVELFKALSYYIKMMFEVNGYHAGLFIIEGILTLFVSISASYLIYYACIALGQRAKKNRVAAAVGVFFAYYMIMQIIGTIMIILVSVFYDAWNINEIIQYLENHLIFTQHMIFGIAVVADAILGVIGFATTKKTITKKLNIE